MAIRADILTQLADVLAELYYDRGSIQTMAAIAGLNLARISFYPKAIDTWVPLLQEAEVNGCTQVILDRAKTEKPVYEPLQLVSQTYADWVTAGRPTAQPVHAPRKLLRAPPPPDTFAGRRVELRKLAEVLLRNWTAAVSAAVPGMGGVGKTTLALKLGSDLAPHFPGGVVWLEAGYGAGQSDLVDRLARTVGIDLANEPLVEKRAAILQSVLTSRGRVFVILDDLWDIDLGRWAGKQLLPADRVLLVTSRDAALCRALCSYIQRLNVLPKKDALKLLTNLLGPPGRYKSAAKELVKLLDGHPLALEIAARLCINGIDDLPWVVRRLQTNPTLGELKLLGQESRDTSVEASVALSYSDLDPDLQQRFRTLGVFAPAPFDLTALAATWEVESLNRAEEVARQLVRRALLAQEFADERPVYRQHMLLRAYAWALLEQAGETDAMTARYVAYYKALPGDNAENWKVAESFWEQIEQGWQHARRIGPENASAYYKAVNFLLYRRARHATHVEWASTLLPLLRQMGDKLGEAQTLNNMGAVYDTQSDKPRALEFYEQALLLFRQVGDKAGEAQTLNNMGLAYSDLGDKPRALELYEQALPLSRQVGDKAGEAQILNNMGGLYSDLGDKPRALELYKQTLPLRHQLGDRAGEAQTLNNMGGLYSALGNKPQALELYSQALSLRRQVGNKAGEATTLNNMGSAHFALGDKPRALEFYEQALPLRREVGDRIGEATTLNNIGAVYYALGDNSRALELFNQALSLRHQVGHKAGEAQTLNNMGKVHSRLGDKPKAIELYEQALSLFRHVGDRANEATTLTNIGEVYSDLGEKQQALAYYEQALSLSREVSSRAGEATTLNNMGNVYSDLGDKLQALELYEQTLTLRRQVGDRWGETITRYNMAMVYQSLNRLDEAEAQLAEVVAQDEAIGHPDLNTHRTTLEEVRAARRTQAADS